MKPETKALLLRLVNQYRGNAEDNLYRCRLSSVNGMKREERERHIEYERGCEAQIRAADEALRDVEEQR